MAYPSNPDSFGINYATKGYSTVAAKDKRINRLYSLIGRRIFMDVPGENKDTRREIVITDLYPYMAIGKYKCGKENKFEFKIGLSIADLVQKGLVSFDKGYAEVV